MIYRALLRKGHRLQVRGLATLEVQNISFDRTHGHRASVAITAEDEAVVRLLDGPNGVNACDPDCGQRIGGTCPPTCPNDSPPVQRSSP